MLRKDFVSHSEETRLHPEADRCQGRFQASKSACHTQRLLGQAALTAVEKTNRRDEESALEPNVTCRITTEIAIRFKHKFCQSVIHYQ